ncbi:MAG: GNAT family N-acetyltransferase [Rhodospirillales bacterium]|nr:GNAT family N-acetyltransferase [Rhodospirillales bacterium]
METSSAEGAAGTRSSGILVRRACARDLQDVIALDEAVTGLAKPEYWRDAFERYGERRLQERFFLVAVVGEAAEGERIVGFTIGEIRAWEFGSEPCGWVFALSVLSGTRLRGVGTVLFEALADEFVRAGVNTLRTMVARDNFLHMTFFRSEGMMAGPYLQLEKRLDQP